MALFYLISRKCRLQSTADGPQSERGNNQMRWDSANSVRDGTSSPVRASRSRIAARLWQPSTNMVSVLPDGAEPRGSNGESCCSRTTVSWHPLTFRCHSPRHCICKHKPLFFSQLRQLREMMVFARSTVAKKASLTSFFSCSSFNAPRCVNPQTQLLGAIINCPCIPQGPP